MRREEATELFPFTLAPQPHPGLGVGAQARADGQAPRWKSPLPGSNSRPHTAAREEAHFLPLDKEQSPQASQPHPVSHLFIVVAKRADSGGRLCLGLNLGSATY